MILTAPEAGGATPHVYCYINYKYKLCICFLSLTYNYAKYIDLLVPIRLSPVYGTIMLYKLHHCMYNI